jgi:hypothetical protein
MSFALANTTPSTAPLRPSHSTQRIKAIMTRLTDAAGPNQRRWAILQRMRQPFRREANRGRNDDGTANNNGNAPANDDEGPATADSWPSRSKLDSWPQADPAMPGPLPPPYAEEDTEAAPTVPPPAYSSSTFTAEDTEAAPTMPPPAYSSPRGSARQENTPGGNPSSRRPGSHRCACAAAHASDPTQA